MAERLRFYTIGTRTSEGYTEVRNELIREGSSRSQVPSRKITPTDEILHSNVRGEFLLTDGEAANLKNDPQIKYVMLSVDKYPELYPLTPEDVYELPTNNTLQNRYSNPTKHYQELFVNSGDKTPDENRADYGTIAEDLNHATSHLIRLTQRQSQWVAENKVDLTATNIDQLNITAHHQQKGAGENVDVIVADDGCWFGHVEFLNSGVTNAVNPVDYIGGNVFRDETRFSGSGYCDLLDIVLDGPYYIDPDFFNASPNTRLTTRFDGTVVPVESVARNWWKYGGAYRSPQFANIGTVDVNNSYTRNNIHGSPTNLPFSVVQGSFGGNGTHGTPCASLTYGRTMGWAYNANKWSISVIGFYTAGGTSVVSGMEKGADMVKIFHQYKPINPNLGTKDPTVMSNSWGFRFRMGSQGSFYYFQNSGATSYSTSDAPTFIDRGGTLFGSSGEQHTPEMQVNSLTDAFGELVTSGVIFLAAAGNQKNVNTLPGNPNFDNRIAKNTTHGIYTLNQFSAYGLDFTGTTNRRGFPTHAGVNQNGDFSEINIQVFENTLNVQYPVISIGVMAGSFKTDNGFQKEQIASYTNRGDGVDIYAPGDGTLAATRYPKNSDGVFGARGVPRFDNIYSGLNAFGNVVNMTSQNYTITECHDAYFNGTSAACPIAAGWLSTIIQYNRDWTYQDVKNYFNTIEPQSTDDFYTGSGEQNTTDPNSPTWADSRNIQGSLPKITYVAPYAVTTFEEVTDDGADDGDQIHQISSSFYVQSGSIAQFKSGMNVTGSIYTETTIRASLYNGMPVGSDFNPIALTVGKALDEGGIEVGAITVEINTPVIISASGNFDTFCFIENQTLDDTTPSNSTWKTVSKGGGNGQFKKTFYERPGGYSSPGIYEYLVIATNEEFRKTSVKGITVKVTV